MKTPRPSYITVIKFARIFYRTPENIRQTKIIDFLSNWHPVEEQWKKAQPKFAHEYLCRANKTENEKTKTKQHKRKFTYQLSVSVCGFIWFFCAVKSTTMAKFIAHLLVFSLAIASFMNNTMRYCYCCCFCWNFFVNCKRKRSKRKIFEQKNKKNLKTQHTVSVSVVIPSLDLVFIFFYSKFKCTFI